MTWADFYLTCFAVGFLLSAISFIAGGMRWQLHLPHFPHAGAHALNGHAATGHVHAPAANTHGTPGTHTGHDAPVSPFNFITLTAFLAWFGGTGYLVTRFSSIWFALGLLIALGAGLSGAAIVFLFLTRADLARRKHGRPTTRWSVSSDEPQCPSAKTVPARLFTRKLEPGAPAEPAARPGAQSKKARRS